MNSRSDELLQKILDTTQTMIFWKDTGRRFMGANRAFLDYYGFSSEADILGRTDEEMGWHSDPGPFQSDEERVLREGLRTYMVHGKCIARGEERDILASKSPLYENGEVIGLVGSFIDVTTEYQQRDEIGRLTEELDGIPAGICIYRPHFGKMVCISVNRCFAHMVGAAPSEFLGRTTLELLENLHPEDRERCVQDAAALYGQKHRAEGTYRFRNFRTGEYVWLHAEGRLVRRPNDEEFVYFAYTDVDAMKQVEMRETRLRQIYESSIEAAHLFVWTYNIRTHTAIMGDNLYTRRRCQELGLPLVAENVPEILMPFVEEGSRQALLRMYADLEAGKPYTEGNVQLKLDADQPPVYLQLSYTTIFDVTGKSIEAYGISRNITKEMLVYQQYKQEVGQVRAEEADRCIAKGHHDLTGNQVMEYVHVWNQALSFSGGVSYDDAVQLFLPTVKLASDRERIADLLDREKLLARYACGEQSFTVEYYRSHGPYAVTWVRMQIYTLRNPMQGNIECFMASFDSTQEHLQQQIQANLAALGYRRMGLIDVAAHQTSYYVLDEKKKQLVAHGGVMGYDAHVEKFILPHVPAPEQEKVRQALDLEQVLQGLQRTDCYRCAYNRRGPGGQMRRMFLQFRYLDEQPQLLCVVQSDITDQYREEQQQLAKLQRVMLEKDKADEAKSSFLSSMSHDLRTPLNGIIGFTHLALSAGQEEKKQEYLEKIKASGQLMLDLINDVLDLSKIASGKMVLRPEVFDGHALILDILHTAQQVAADKKVELRADIDGLPLGGVRADRLRLQQILLNLLSNAVKYTPPGGHVRFRLLPGEDGYDYRFCVEDDGIGIGSDFLPHIFEPFQQEQAIESRNIQGTGLGLAIVKRIVELMNGRIEVVSHKGEGSCFTVQLNLSRADGPTADAEPAEEKAPCSLAGRRVLLCEDNALNAEIAQALLNERGVQAVLASDGQEGVNRFAASPVGGFDAILMDLRMPVMDGLEATRTIRAMPRPDAGTIPIIAMTADAFKENVDQCLAAGMNAHVAKPINVDALFRVLAAAIALPPGDK